MDDPYEREAKKLKLQQKEQQIRRANEEADEKNSSFIEAATEGNVKKLALLIKNIDELELESIETAHNIAVDQLLQPVISLTQRALDKKKGSDVNKALDCSAVDQQILSKDDAEGPIECITEGCNMFGTALTSYMCSSCFFNQKRIEQKFNSNKSAKSFDSSSRKSSTSMDQSQDSGNSNTSFDHGMREDQQHLFKGSGASTSLAYCLPEDQQLSFKDRVYNKKAFILNYIQFPSTITVKYDEETTNTYKISSRRGASMDSKNLKSTFHKLGYDVNLHENRTKDQTNTILDYIQQHQDLDFVVLFISSHGFNKSNEDVFATSDGCLLSLKNIQNRFNDRGCPHLIGKTKIILANFCRGASVETDSVSVSHIPERHAVPFPLVEIKDSQPPRNMITIFSSHEGFAAVRHVEKGTFFVWTLCEILNNKTQQSLSIQDIFNLISDKMKQIGGTTPEMRISGPVEKFIF